MKQNSLSGSAAKAIRYLAEDGPIFTAGKTAYVFKERFLRPMLPEAPFPCASLTFPGETRVLLKDLPATAETPFRIGIHLHLYYEDLLPEFVSFFRNMPVSYSLFVSCKEDADLEAIRIALSWLPHLQELKVEPVPNRGRDLSPFFLNFREDLLSRDLILHVHSKKSLHSGRERVEWRTNALKGLLGSHDQILKILTFFHNHPKTGALWNENYREVSAEGYSWLSCKDAARTLFHTLSFPEATQDALLSKEFFLYPAGSFFWIRTDAIRPLLAHPFIMEDFQEEAGQKDGTAAHVLERCFGLIPESLGFENGILDSQNGMLRTGFSRLSFRSLFEGSKKNLTGQAAIYKTIGFSVFETLITTCLDSPEDLFLFTEQSLNDRLKKETGFFRHRILAEKEARRAKGERASLDEIYSLLERSIPLSHEEAGLAQRLELSLLKRLTVPRAEMRSLFYHLKKKKKTLLLVSDTVYPSSVVKELLVLCGYPGDCEIWLSCEKNASKKEDTIWDLIFSLHPSRTFLMIGQDPEGDLHTPAARQIAARLVPSVASSLELSAIRRVFPKAEDRFASLLKGIAFHAGFFNAPFCLEEQTALPRIHDAELRNGLLLPLLLCHMASLKEEQRADVLSSLSSFTLTEKELRDLLSTLLPDTVIPEHRLSVLSKLLEQEETVFRLRKDLKRFSVLLTGDVSFTETHERILSLLFTGF